MRMLAINCRTCGRPIEGPLGENEHGAYVHPYDCQNTPVCPCCGMAGVNVFKVAETPDGVLLHGMCGACGWTDFYAADLAPHTFNPMTEELRAAAITKYRGEHGLNEDADASSD